ncbi:MAG: helix-turn-helix domain-containing protein, partial [Fibrobacter sp.]|nr:helix-turn-helix domain-containing protein [Fibrobacter sp.]
VFATHKDLQKLVSQGTFRHDLWYRISAFVLNVSPLSERKDDIIPLAQYFLKNMSADLGIKKTFTDAALQELLQLNFEGNVRELKHLVARAAVYSDSETIDKKDITEQYSQKTKSQSDETAENNLLEYKDFKIAKLEFEKQFLKAALDSHQGNITATARTIGLAQSNLSRKLKELGIS